MKNLPRHRLRILSLASLGLLAALYFLCHPEAGGADWKFIEKDDEGLWIYDAETVKGLSNHRVKVQTRKIYEREAVIAMVDKYGTPYEDLDHVLAEWEIDCVQKKFKLCSAIFYSKGNVLIERYDAEKEGCLAPDDISPDSYLELLRKRVCR